ncbi:hypothetical protein TPA0906_72380 [Streptomyces olivaceus]|nr:hypothetical protein TPA0906_72380 [Streptomyces olivaceus]
MVKARTLTPARFAAAEHGLSRRVAVVLPGHLAALALAARTDAVALVPAVPDGAGAPPSPLTEQASALGLRLLDIPMALPPVAIGMAWHPRHTADGAHHWLRDAVRRVLCD